MKFTRKIITGHHCKITPKTIMRKTLILFTFNNARYFFSDGNNKNSLGSFIRNKKFDEFLVMKLTMFRKFSIQANKVLTENILK